jgi:hypothetical protein
MLIGAAVGATAGGAGAAIQGGDPLKGALMGGAMGAVGGGLGGAAGGAGAGAVEGGTAGATTGGAGAGTAVTPTANAIVGSGAGAGTGGIYGGASQGIAGATQIGAGVSGAGTGGGFGLTAPAAGTTFGSLAAPTGATVGAGMGSGAGGSFGIAAPTVAGGAGAGAAGGAGAGSASGLGVAQGSALPAGYGTSTPPATNIFGQTLGQPGVLSNTALGTTAAGAGLSGAMQAERGKYGMPTGTSYSGGNLNKLKYDPDKFTASEPTYAPESVYRPTYAAEGGIMKLAQGGMPGPVERMTQNMMGGQGNMYPQSQQEHTNFATPTQMPASAEIIRSDYDAKTNPYTGVMMAKGGVARFDGGGLGSAAMGIPSTGSGAGAQTMMDQGIAALGQANKKRMLTKEQMDAIRMQGLSKGAMQDIYGQMAAQGLAAGGHLGGYSDGGRMLKGPGDGMSDNIPATIAGKQPARLADGEFVVPADVVSHLGNGSTDAGAKQLYAMMNRVRKARTGNPKQGKQIKPAKYMAA